MLVKIRLISVAGKIALSFDYALSQSYLPLGNYLCDDSGTYSVATFADSET